MIDPVLDRIDGDLGAALERLKGLLRIPSISTDPAYASACQDAAEWLRADLASLGFEAEICPTPGHPMVMARNVAPGPHIIFYGHYDVQPVDPIDLWDNDPFDPQIEDTAHGQVIRGRGTSDDKGQLMTFLEACRAWIAEYGSLPINLTVFLEGEEESGSPSLIPFMKDNADRLSGEVALICDTGLFGTDTPAIVTRLRGLCGEEIEITGPSKDLHSGMYGGPARNPIQVLTQILAGLQDDTGRVTLKGFYDGVPPLPDDIAVQWAQLGFDHGQFLGDVGLSEPAGEDGYTALEKIWSRPTCEINGIWGGYTGDGFKTVLPSKASAKVSFRLVGQQDPHAIRAALRAYVTAALPPDCSVAFTEHGASPAAEMSTDNPIFEMARAALTEEWPKPAAFTGCGGSIPIAGYFKTYTGTDALLAGFGLDDDQIHSPNEKYAVRSFHKGTRSWARLIAKLAQQSG